MKQYSFYFDSSSCSGCKACQIACKDKHGLEVGRLWRRVYEISGGKWHRHGSAWRHTVFAYHLSIACNHCEKPICAEVCPVKAIYKRPDGIVLIDELRCMGCGYCSWACPYGALQYNSTTGTMTKCTFCVDELEDGKAPACVTACPMRALEYGERSELVARYGQLESIYPLPQNHLTEPALALTAHKDTQKTGNQPVRLSNREEVHTQDLERDQV
jgi:anaerobic dimethyl sulfoxide reductase subunit B (iron-sulfur subunit)